MEEGFKTSLFGFDRGDVLRYVELTSKKIDSLHASYKNQLDELNLNIKNLNLKNEELQSTLDKQKENDLRINQLQEEVERLKSDNLQLTWKLQDLEKKAHDYTVIQGKIYEQIAWCDLKKAEFKKFISMIQEKLREGADSLDEADFDSFDRMKESLIELETRDKE